MPRESRHADRDKPRRGGAHGCAPFPEPQEAPSGNSRFACGPGGFIAGRDVRAAFFWLLFFGVQRKGTRASARNAFNWIRQIAPRAPSSAFGTFPRKRGKGSYFVTASAQRLAFNSEAGQRFCFDRADRAKSTPSSFGTPYQVRGRLFPCKQEKGSSVGTSQGFSSTTSERHFRRLLRPQHRLMPGRLLPGQPDRLDIGRPLRRVLMQDDQHLGA